MQGMSSVKLPFNMPSLENASHESTNLPQRIQTFCQEQKEKRRQEWESLKVALEKMKESKEMTSYSARSSRKRHHICPDGTEPRKNKGDSKKHSQ